MGSGYLAAPSTSTPPPGPTLPVSLPGLGKDGADHIHNALRILSNLNASVASWPDAAATSADPLTRFPIGSNTVEPVLMEENGVRFVRFKGVDLRSAQVLSSPHSAVVLMRSSTLNTPLVRIAGCSIDRHPTTKRYRATWGSAAAGGTVKQTNGATFGYVSDGWVLFQHAADPTVPYFKVNGEAVSTATAGGYSWGGSSPGLRLIQHPVDPVTDAAPAEFVDIAFHATFPFNLSVDDMASNYAAAQAGYPGAALP